MTVKKSILFLTDLSNGEEEDLITADFLRGDFEVTISYFDEIEKIEDKFDLIVIRDTWPSDESKVINYHKLSSEFFKRVKEKKLKIYNDIKADCDRLGKDYLVDLYKKSFPVIPSVDSLKDIHILPEADEYLVKPKDGLSSFGIRTISKDNLSKLECGGCIIQPKLIFLYEVSFYFIDGEFLYSLIFEPSKIPKWPEPKVYKPTEKEIEFAKKFIKYDKMEYGVCRIDALRMTNGELLMLEIEDASPYFSITEIDKKLRELFLEKFKKSIVRVINKF